MEGVEVTVTCADDEEADRIGRTLVEERLPACAQRWPVRSCYRWQGTVEQADEVMLALKTTSEQASAVVSRVAQLHSYDLPATVVVPVLSSGPGYLAWLAEGTGGAGRG